MKNKPFTKFIVTLCLLLVALLALNAPVYAMESYASSNGTYYLPFEWGQPVPVSRAGPGSGKGEHNLAVDFSVGEGTPIYSSHGGVILNIIDSNTKHACNPSYAKYNNFVAIYDNNINETHYYLHIYTNSVPKDLKIGQYIPAGTFIGKSGKIGYTCGANPAHLHFEVESGKRNSPIPSFRVNPKFSDIKGNFAIGGGKYVSQNPHLPFQPYMVDTTKVYFIQAAHSGKVMDVNGASKDNGANIIQYSLHYGVNQQWRFDALSGADQGYYRIISLFSGKCLDINGVSLDNGAKLIQYACNVGSDNQKWRLYNTSDGIVIQAKHSGKVLDVSGDSMNDGAQIIQWNFGGVRSKNQLWKLKVVQVPGLPSYNVNTAGVYKIQASHSGQVLDILFDAKSDGAKIIQKPENPLSTSQQWRFAALTGADQGYYQIRSVWSGKCLDITGGSSDNGANLIQYKCDTNSDNQKWRLYDANNGGIVIQAKHSGRVLDVKGASLSNGAEVVQWDFGGINQKNQVWKLVNPFVCGGSPSSVSVEGLCATSTPKNTPSKTPVPWIKFTGNPSSSLFIDQNGERANLTVCADNIVNKTVYVIFWRAGSEWSYHDVASSRCITFWDMDGAGPLFANTNYFSVAALGALPDKNWPIPCYEATGGYGLCDTVRMGLPITPTATGSSTPISVNLTATIQVATITPTFSPTIPAATITPTFTDTLTPLPTATITATPIAPFEIQVNSLGAGFTSSMGQARNGWAYPVAQGKAVSCSQDAPHLIYTQTNNGVEFSWGRWMPTLPYTGNYTVYVYIPQYTHNTAVTSSAKYTVTYSGGSTTIVVDQNANLCGWTYIGTYPFVAGTSGNVYVDNNTNDGKITLLAADAVKFVWTP